MKQQIFQAIDRSPIIAAVKNDQGLKKVLQQDSKVIFVLYGDLMNMDYLRRCLGKVEVIRTSLRSEPAFVNEKVDLI